MLSQVPLFLILGAVMLVVQIVWYVLLQSTSSASRADASLQALTIAFPNLAGVGLPIAASLLGPSGAVPVAVSLAAGSILVTPLSLILVDLSVRNSGTSPAQILTALSRALAKPVVFAPAFGILVCLLGLSLGPVVKSSLSLIGTAAPGVALFLTGLVLSSQSFQLDWKVIIATAVADIFRPLLAAAVAFLLPVPWETARIAILIAAVPSGFFGILFAVNYRLDSAAAGSMVLASTIFSVMTLTIVITLLFGR
jgi:malonate transporter